MIKEKGITLIALVITIIVMLILTGATIAIVTEGGLIDKAQSAKTNTQAAADQETNDINTAGDKIDQAVAGNSAHVKTVFEFNKNYPELFINPNPSKIMTNITEYGMGIRLYDNNDNRYIVFADLQYTTTWELEGTNIAEGTEPTNPNEGDLWHNPEGQYSIYEYTNGQWVLRDDIGLYRYDNNFIGGLAYMPYISGEWTIGLYKCIGMELLYPEMLVLETEDEEYRYVYTAVDAIEASIYFGTTFQQGWNSLEENYNSQTNEYEYSADPVLYENLPKLTNVSYLIDLEEQEQEQIDYFNIIKDIMSNYLSDTPW